MFNNITTWIKSKNVTRCLAYKKEAFSRKTCLYMCAFDMCKLPTIYAKTHFLIKKETQTVLNINSYVIFLHLKQKKLITFMTIANYSGVNIMAYCGRAIQFPRSSEPSFLEYNGLCRPNTYMCFMCIASRRVSALKVPCLYHCTQTHTPLLCMLGPSDHKFKFGYHGGATRKHEDYSLD